MRLIAACLGQIDGQRAVKVAAKSKPSRQFSKFVHD